MTKAHASIVSSIFRWLPIMEYGRTYFRVAGMSSLFGTALVKLPPPVDDHLLCLFRLELCRTSPRATLLDAHRQQICDKPVQCRIFARVIKTSAVTTKYRSRKMSAL